MISASTMIPGKTQHPPPGHGILKNGHPQQHHMVHPHGHGVMDTRYRLDSQKFRVPSLPMSNSGRHETVGGSQKHRKERSLLNGNHLQDVRSRYDLIPQPQQHSPRQGSRDPSVSPMYNDMIHPGHHPHQLSSNPTSYTSRSSVPIPCSSPATATSASPKANSPSTNKNSTAGRGQTYSPQLPGGHDLSSHLYSHSSSNGYPHLQHPSLGMQNHHAAFFAAAAAAAASGTAYPGIFGSPYAPHSHSAASSYLDSFHSNILAQQQQQQKLGAAGSGAPYLPPHLRVPYHPQTTSTTSLHTKLIESASERYNGHAHAHYPSIPTSRNGDYGMIQHCNGLSKGGPLGMGPLEPPLTIQSTHSKKVGGSVGKEGTNYHASHTPRNQWVERNHLPISASANPSFAKTSPSGLSPTHYEHIRGELLHKQAPLYLPPTVHSEIDKQRMTNMKTLEDPQKELFLPKKAKISSNIFTFPLELPLSVTKHGVRNGNHNGMDFANGNDMAEGHGHTGLDVQSKAMDTRMGHVLNPFQPPGSPKRRKVAAGSSVQAQWTNVTGAAPTSPSQHQLTQGEPVKYLNYNKSKPNSVPSSPSYLKGPHPQSPKVPKSPTVTFKLGSKVPQSPKKVLQAHNENHLNSRSLLLPPMPIEEMPLLEAFRHGSPIQLASGEVKSVENLCGEDFAHSAAQMMDKVKIVNCKVLAIQEMRAPSPTSRPFCKVTLGMESHKQQVVLDSTLEQPFFVLGRGWSSLSPEMSLNLLQLQCSSLQIGDICMALTRTPGKPQTENVPAKPRTYSYHHQSPNPKAIATVRPGNVIASLHNLNNTHKSETRTQNETVSPPQLVIAEEGHDNTLSSDIPLSLTLPKVSGMTVSFSTTQNEPTNDVTTKSQPLSCISATSPVNLQKRRWSNDQSKDVEVKESEATPTKIQTDGTRPSILSLPASTTSDTPRTWT